MKLTGEITRSFRKHKVFGTVYAVESDDTGTVLAAAVVTEATACRHTLAGMELTLDEVKRLNDDHRDYEFFEPVCSDAKHLLDEIGEQVRVVAAAESEATIAHASAKECKETADKARATLLKLVREATNPTPLPLFDRTGAAEALDEHPSDKDWYLDGVNVKRCVKCFKVYPCGTDHSADPPSAPPVEPRWPLDNPPFDKPSA